MLDISRLSIRAALRRIVRFCSQISQTVETTVKNRVPRARGIVHTRWAGFAVTSLCLAALDRGVKALLLLFFRKMLQDGKRRDYGNNSFRSGKIVQSAAT
jgi:hypothetical protein